jgi:hypothetical protein
MPSPTAHVLHGVLALRPGEAVNVPSALSVHTRSLEAVAAVLVYVPAPHAGLTGWQISPLAELEKKPAVQAVQMRSVVAEPTADWP